MRGCCADTLLERVRLISGLDVLDAAPAEPAMWTRAVGAAKTTLRRTARSHHRPLHMLGLTWRNRTGHQRAMTLGEPDDGD